MPAEAQLLHAIHAHASSSLDQVFLVSHHMGTSRTWTALITLAVVFCALRGLRRHALTWLVLGLGVDLTQRGLKALLARSRPALWPHMVAHHSPSMPSGHALASVAFYGLAAHILARRQPRRASLYYGAAALLSFFVGFGRLYLGVHWPSDVVVGWSIGALYAYLARRALWPGEATVAR